MSRSVDGAPCPDWSGEKQSLDTSIARVTRHESPISVCQVCGLHHDEKWSLRLWRILKIPRTELELNLRVLFRSENTSFLLTRSPPARQGRSFPG